MGDVKAVILCFWYHTDRREVGGEVWEQAGARLEVTMSPAASGRTALQTQTCSKLYRDLNPLLGGHRKGPNCSLKMQIFKLEVGSDDIGRNSHNICTVSLGVRSLLRICTPTELTLISKVPNPVCILTYSLIVCMNNSPSTYYISTLNALQSIY